MDTQSIKTAVTVPARDQGADPGKKIVGRKRGLVTDVLGLVLAACITAANTADNHHAQVLLAEAEAANPGISVGFVDQGFKKQAVDKAAKIGVRLVTTVGLATKTSGFTPAQKHWVVERSIGTLMFKRRLTRDHEKQPQSSAAQIYIVQIAMRTRRLTGQTVPSWRGC
jgi:transposase